MGIRKVAVLQYKIDRNLIPYNHKHRLARFAYHLIVQPSDCQGMVTTPLYFFNAIFFLAVVFGNAPVYLSAIHFHIYWCKNLAKIVLPRESVYQKVKCLGWVVTTPRISAPMKESNEISKATSMFMRSSYPMKSTGMLYDQTGSGKSKMAASIPEVPTSRARRHHRNTILEAIIYVFKVWLSSRTIRSIARPNRK